MSEKWVHEYFDRKSSEWTIKSFLDECEAQSFPDKIGQYLTSLEAIAKNESGKRSEKALHLYKQYKQGSRTDRQISRDWLSQKSKESAGTSVHIHHPTFKDSSLGIGTVNGGTFNTGLSSKQGQESDDDFQPIVPARQKRKKNLSLSKKDKKSNGSVKKVKTTGRKDDNIDNPFISNNGAINLADSSDFSKDNYSSSSSSIKGSFISASFGNKSQDISPGSEGWEIESIDVVRGEEEIGELNQDEIIIRNKLLTILLTQQEKDIKSGKDILSSTSLNNIIDLSNNEVQTEVNKSLNTNQIEWINRVLRKKVWNKTCEFQQYISQFTEDVCDRIHIPVLVRESFVPKGSFNSYNHESHDIAQQIMTHFSVRLEAPRRVESESLDYERTYSIDTVIYIINRLFRMHQDVVDLVWIELTTPDTKKHKIDGLTKIISTIQKNQTIILIEFSFGSRAPKSKEDNDHIKLCRNSMRTLNKLLQSIPKDIARVYLIQSVNGLIEIKYLVRPLPSIYILQLFTCVKIPVSFDDFEQFAKNIVDLMEWQVDVLSTVRKMNKVTTGNTHNHIISVQDTPEKKKEAEKNPSSPKSPCPGKSISESLPLI